MRFVGNRTLSADKAVWSHPASVTVDGFAFIRTQLSHCRLSFSASAPLMLARAVPAIGQSATGCQRTAGGAPRRRRAGAWHIGRD